MSRRDRRRGRDVAASSHEMALAKRASELGLEYRRSGRTRVDRARSRRTDACDSGSARPDHGSELTSRPRVRTIWFLIRRASTGRGTATAVVARSSGGSAPPCCGCATANRSAACSRCSRRPLPRFLQAWAAGSRFDWCTSSETPSATATCGAGTTRPNAAHSDAATRPTSPRTLLPRNAQVTAATTGSSAGSDAGQRGPAGIGLQLR
jgi:hypothetical protein